MMRKSRRRDLNAYFIFHFSKKGAFPIMPQPQNYSHPDLTELLSISYEALNYSPHTELYNQAIADFVESQPDKEEKDPITGENSPKATKPETVSKVTSTIEKLYMDTTQNLGLTDPAAQPFQHAMRTMYRNYFLIALNGGSVERQKRYNPFLIALRGRIPDLIGPDKFKRGQAVQDPDQLWQELKNPARELSGFEEMETVMKRVPLPKLLQALSNGSLLFYDAIENHAGMNPKEQEDTRTQMLDFVREARFERLGAFTYSEEEGTWGAAHLKDSVTKKTKQSRLSRLMELQRGISFAYNQSRIGSEVRVLVDGYADGILVCRSEFESPEVDGEILVPCPQGRSPQSFVGQFMMVRINGADDYDLRGDYLRD